MSAKMYYLASITAIILWSASFIATKFAYISFSPIMVGFIRFLIAFLVLFFIRLLMKDTINPTRKDMPKIALSGLLGITLYFTAENIGLQLTTASNAALIVASYPAITALLEAVIYKIKPSPRKIIGIALAFGGIFLLSAQGNTLGSESIWGNLLLVAAGVIWTFYNFITRSVTAVYPPLTLSLYQFLFGTIFFVPLVLLEEHPISAITKTSVAAMIYLSLGCSIIAFLLYNFGLRRLSAAASVSLMNLVPVFGILFSSLFLHESITLVQIIGGSIVVIGVMLSASPNISSAK